MLAVTPTSLPAPIAPSLVNDPPITIVWPLTAMVCTVPLGAGFHGSTAPVRRSIAAAWLRAICRAPGDAPAGLTDVNFPPRYAVVPLMTTTSTRPLV